MWCNEFKSNCFYLLRTNDIPTKVCPKSQTIDVCLHPSLERARVRLLLAEEADGLLDVVLPALLVVVLEAGGEDAAAAAPNRLM